MAKDAPAKKAAKKASVKKEAAEKAPVEKRRVVIPKGVYEARKDEIKAPFKEHALKWQFLGEGKGRYHKEGVHVFVQFTDAGVDYAVWGEDRATVDAILGAWEGILGASGVRAAERAGADAAKAEQAAKESEALRLWKLQEPQRRPGEPDFFFKKRVAEWEAKRPTE